MLSSAGGGRERLELVRDRGGGAALGGAALGVTESVVLAHSSGRPAGAPGRAEKGEARAGAPSGITVSGAVSIESASGRGGGAAAVCWGGCGGGGRSGQSRLLAEWGSLELGHFAGAAGQQSRTGLRFPPLGHEGLGHLCSAFVWLSEQKGQMGASSLHRCLTCPNFQHFSDCVWGEEE